MKCLELLILLMIVESTKTEEHLGVKEFRTRGTDGYKDSEVSASNLCKVHVKFGGLTG